jgi:ADP-heptose:LPS heptosyltransferase
LAQCVAGEVPKKLPLVLLEEQCAPALFGILVEGLADRFEPALCDAYARLFAQAIASADPEWDAASLVARYERVRRPRPITGKLHRVVVLSRVTLGADVAVTSVLLAAAKRRFPHAEIVFAGPRKNYELFAGDPHIHHFPLEYPRGTVRERLVAADPLKKLLDASGTIAIDPDSRFTQLGLVPVCVEDRYYLFESRAYGANTSRNLPELASEWAREIIGAGGVKPYVALGPLAGKAPTVTVSLGVGENLDKRIPDPFEAELLKLLAGTGLTLCIDKGAGGAEGDRVQAALDSAGVQATIWEGSFAGFAQMIAASQLYVGYDSAGQHVAAACGVPLVSIFAGFPAPRFQTRWSPRGRNCYVIPVDEPEAEATLSRVRQLLPQALAAPLSIQAETA